MMEKQTKQSYIMMMIIACTTFLLNFFSGAVLRCSLSVSAVVAAFQLIGILLPGMAAYCLLADSTKSHSFWSILILSYAYGYSINILSYFLFVPFQQQRLIPYWTIGLGIVSLLYLFCNRANLCISPLKKEDRPLLLLFFLVFLLSFLAYSARLASPVVTGIAKYPTDLMYWIENASALSISFPAYEPRVALHKILYYHYFTSIQLAYMKLATGVNLFSLAVTFFSFGKSILLFGSLYLLLSKYPRKFLYLGLVILLFCTGLEMASFATYCHHIWLLPFGFDIGFSYGALFLYMFLQQMDQKFSFRLWIPSILFFGICTGCKAPVAVVLLMVPAVICLTWLLRRECCKAFGYGLPILAVFLLIAIFCVGVLKGSVTSSGGFSLSGIRRILQITLLSNPVITLLFVYGLFCIAKHPERRTPVYFALVSSSVFGVLLGTFYLQDGGSQMYFTMAAYIPSLLFGIDNLSLSSFEFTCKTLFNKLMRVFIGVQIFAMLFIGYTGGILVYAAIGLTHLAGFYPESVRYQVEYMIERDDYDAMDWIRTHTPTTSVVLSDRSILLPDNNRYMYYGVFSERQAYLEGDIYYRNSFLEERERRRDLVKRLFANDTSALSEAIQDGADYVVQTKWLTPDFAPDSTLAELVYSTNTINVYKLSS